MDHERARESVRLLRIVLEDTGATGRSWESVAIVELQRRLQRTLRALPHGVREDLLERVWAEMVREWSKAQAVRAIFMMG
jgi:hypothetical protein